MRCEWTSWSPKPSPALAGAASGWGRALEYNFPEVLAAEGLSGLRDCRFQRAWVAKHGLLATLFHDEAMEEQYLSQAEVAHYRKRS
jgi:hypothetical protein